MEMKTKEEYDKIYNSSWHRDVALEFRDTFVLLVKVLERIHENYRNKSSAL